MEPQQRDCRHRRTGWLKKSSNLLFCCFNWGAASMKMRKLRRSGNGGMFKKSGEVEEPSSPKVSCIGLVRVKTKRNQVMKKMRTKSKRRRGGGEASFRRVDHEQSQRVVVLHHQESLPHRDHRWIHLPFAICEALKGLMSCVVVPDCSSSACTNWGVWNRRCSMRWLFALQESEAEKNAKRGVEVVVHKRETEIKIPSYSSSSSTSSDVDQFHRRRSVDESKERIVVDDDVEVIEEARLSICSVPPRDALLLMRSRSEPGRRSTLATRFLDDCVLKSDHENGSAQFNRFDIEADIEAKSEREIVKTELVLVEENRGKVETEQSITEEIKIGLSGSSPEPVLEDDNNINNIAITVVEEESLKIQDDVVETERCEHRHPLMEGHEESITTLEEEKVDEGTSMAEKLEAHEQQQQEQEQEQREIDLETEELHCEDVVVNETHLTVNEEEDGQDQDEGGESRRTSNEIDRTAEMLSDCLMMMMREPKVSMELSKETWVCSTDFIRHHRQHHHQNQVNPINGGDKSKTLIKIKPSSNNVKKPKPITQPPPPPLPKPALRDKKPVNVNGGAAKKSEPLELTRCKSEPMRSSAKLAAEACFWKDMKLIVEPHRRSTVGAAGVGF